ncbi:MAG: site-specific DNA-methyltransferase [Candidatus Hydrothermota bacterium]|nr:MAG: site-specific DNA-methyltransferase [Candidatus Hydrothermae bacterium]
MGQILKDHPKILFYGDNLKVMREYIPDESVDLIYLDPPFKSKRDYNILFKEPTGEPSKAQIIAFEDTWHWTDETEWSYREIMRSAPARVVEMMKAFRNFLGENDYMAYLVMITVRLLEMHRVLKPSGSIYFHCDPTMSHYVKIVLDTIFYPKNFRNEIVWCYTSGGVSKRYFGRKHQILFFYTKSERYYFKPLYRPYSDKTIQRGLTKVKGKYFEKGLRKEGAILQDWWTIQPLLSPTSKERLGYPTQKPRALLERILRASAPPDGTVLDPFCGCGTTISAAEALNHTENGYNLSWIGIDITHLAINLIKMRLKNEFGLEPGKDYAVVGEPVDIAGAKQLAQADRYQFQWWALSLIGARPWSDRRKKGADKGIDGILYIQEPLASGKYKTKRIIVQVKSGKVGVRDIRDFRGVLEREDDAVMGIFITLEKPTSAMMKEANAAGYYEMELTGRSYPRLQILTIEELLSGIRPKMPEAYIWDYLRDKRSQNNPKPQNTLI